MNEGTCSLTNLFDSQIKSRLINLGWLVEAAQLAHELKRGCPDLFVCCRGLKVKERLNVPTHDHLQNLTFNYHVVERGLAKSTSLMAPSDLLAQIGNSRRNLFGEQPQAFVIPGGIV